MSGYGTYRVRFKTSGPRKGPRYWIFLYYAPDGDYTPTANELDFIEVWGDRGIGDIRYASEFIPTFWRKGSGGRYGTSGGESTPGGGSASQALGVSYWYVGNAPPDDIVPLAVNWEDGQWHEFIFDYAKDHLIMYCDGVKIFEHHERQTKDYDVQPLPPMQLMIGGSAKQAFSEPFQFIIEEIEFIAEGDLVAKPSGPYKANVNSPIVQFQGSAIGGTAPYSYLWNFGDGQTSTQQNPIHTYPVTEAIYNVMLTVTDATGATASSITTVTISPSPCFVATVAYGSSLAPQLNVLRHFRDKCLPDALVVVYYCVGAHLASWIKGRKAVKRYVREVLNLLVRLLKRGA
jgi:hypothetical protein